MLLGLIGEHCSQLIGVTNWRTVVILRRRTEARQELFSAQFALKLSRLLLGRMAVGIGFSVLSLVRRIGRRPFLLGLLRSLLVGVYRGGHLVHTGRVGTGFNAPPMTFEVNGKQYIAILAGLSPIARGKHQLIPELKEQRNQTMLFVFGL